MNWVTLEPHEIFLASQVGVLRRYTSIADGMKDRAGRKMDFSADIDGAAGEMAFAKGMNLYWSGGNKTFSVPDVGIVEVKTARSSVELPVYEHIPDDRIVALVFGNMPKFRIVGWIYAKDAKKIVPLSNKGLGYQSAHFVTEDKLRPIQELKNILNSINKKEDEW